jgi:hypothetical protein
MTVPSGAGHAFLFISDLRGNEKKCGDEGVSRLADQAGWFRSAVDAVRPASAGWAR